jgi:hypothetical protein
VSAAGLVGLGSNTDAVSAGAVSTGQSLLALARTGVSLGGATTAVGGTTYIADSSMLSLLGPNDDPSPIFNATPVALAGPVSISGPVATGRFVSASAGAFTAQAAITAATNATIRTGGAATFNGTLSAPQIAVRSADIGIGASGGIGGANTVQTALTVETGVSAIGIGGNSASGYSIDQAEVARLRGQSISITVPTQTQAPVVNLGAFTLSGSNAATPNLVGSAGSFSVQTPGAIRVTGAVRLNNAPTSNRLVLSSGTQVQLIADQGGSLRLAGDADALGGTLELSAADIISGDAAIVSQLSADPALAARAQLLGATSGPADLLGTLVANRITVNVGRAFLLQNTGNLRQRAGFTAGTGGLTIRAVGQGTDPVDVIINGQSMRPPSSPSGIVGQAVTADGFLTNENTREVVMFVPGQTGRGFSEATTVNGCGLGSAPCTIFANDEVTTVSVQAALDVSTEGGPADTPSAEEEEELREETSEGDSRPNVLVSRMIDASAVEDTPPVTEPVSGAGNPDLWQGGEPQ